MTKDPNSDAADLISQMIIYILVKITLIIVIIVI